MKHTISSLVFAVLCSTHALAEDSANTPVAAPNYPASNSTQSAPCQFTAPDSFSTSVTHWEGECEHGVAHGRGVLKGYPATNSAKAGMRFFFGNMQQGKPVLGALQIPNEHPYDETDANIVTLIKPTPDNEGHDEPLGAAIDAAVFVSDRYAKRGNAASAAFYAEKARELEMMFEGSEDEGLDESIDEE